MTTSSLHLERGGEGFFPGEHKTLSVADLLFKDFHFRFSSLLSASPPHSTTFVPSNLLLLLTHNSPTRNSKPTGSSSFRRAKLLSEPLRAGSGVGCVHSAGAESQHPSGGHTWAA